MRLGVVVRMDDRGLAFLTQEFARHMAPERVLVVDMNDPRFPLRPIWPTVGTRWFYSSFDGGVLHGPIDEFLSGLSHVYTAETGYDVLFFDRARYHGVASICHVMPEFDNFTGERPEVQPTAVWVPTDWRSDLVARATVVPVPCPLAPRPRRRTEIRTVVHVGGSRAMPDRAGSRSVFDAVQWATGAVRWIFYTQRERGYPRSLEGRDNVEIRCGSVDDRWALYDEADLLIAPRRFGGLSLPVLEAAACGLPVLMLDTDPMARFGSVFVEGKPQGGFMTAGGEVEIREADSWLIGQAVTDLVKGDNDIGAMSDAQSALAELNAWPVAVEFYREAIERVTLDA